ncbi:S9 family peptidase [Saccharomonospora cyanea]|uniref:Dipeptidyl aminopeptidase/acylaminoacyl peptidase n=1 Tax=Saccharomonospora cyanea NA-134 TaxID=882082 RepID=H5XR27_9PSEU|nr:S9 family peptidase [Saccharomonospora cyanea]EHR62268.1 dipeptidyl aminopeptidase/acylaminoacyl peptidase [Saccharomonospora cyanea NA-134]
MRPTDLGRTAVPGRPALRGELLLTAVARPDPDTDTYRSSLVRIDSGETTPWTHGERDTAPAISPDGRWVAFLRATGTDAPQLYVMPSSGGESRRLTHLPLGAGAPVWAPDSRRIAFTARVPEPGRYGTAVDSGGEVLSAERERPRRITRFDYRLDDEGFVRDRPRRLFVVDVETAGTAPSATEEPAPLTGAAVSVKDPAWTPDGTGVVVAAPRDWDARETQHQDLYVIPADGGEPELLVRCPGAAAHPVVADDGTVFFYGTAFDGFAAVARNTGLWATSLDTKAPPRRLTDVETVDCESAAGPPVPRRNDVLVAVRHRGAVELRGVPRDADGAVLDTLPLVTGDRAAVRSFAADGDRVAVVQAGPADTGEVLLVGADGSVRALTDFSAALREAGIRPVDEVTATAPDGYPVHGWVVTPEGEGPHPVLLVVHGGPFAQYDWGLFDEAQIYASAGYLVVLPNPRGSAGYGESHGRAIVGALGTVDADDVLALLDAVLERPDADADRVGVMGGSYGGFMTGWLAAHHGHRFRAAWSERAVNAWDSFTGSSDIGWWFASAYVGDDVEEQRRRSPLTYADRINIPFAIAHSEHDWRCPIEQAQRMFVAVKTAGCETELLLFPGEGHELTRSGRPRHRIQRFDAVLEWWQRHLPVS